MTPPSSDDPSDDGEWRYSLDDLSDDDASDDPGEDDAPAGDGSIFGPRPDEGAVEVVAGDPDLENVLFVVLGVATTLLLLANLVGVV